MSKMIQLYFYFYISSDFAFSSFAFVCVCVGGVTGFGGSGRERSQFISKGCLYF